MTIIFIIIIMILLLSLSFSLLMVMKFDAYKPRLAIDYGPRLIGIAAGTGVFSKPLLTLPHSGDLVDLSTKILTIAQSNNVIEILIGLPLDGNGKMSHDIYNFNGRLCLNFTSVLSAVSLKTNPNIKIVLVDERYTTKEAKIRMKAEKLKATIDAVAALCILDR